MNVLTNSFCIKIMFMYLLETANINANNNFVALLLGCNQVSFTQGYSISFSFIFHTFCPYLESLLCFHGKDLIVQSLYVHLKDRKARWK